MREADIGEESDGVLRHGEERVLCDYAHVPMRRIAHAKAHPDTGADGHVGNGAARHIAHLVVLRLEHLDRRQ